MLQSVSTNNDILQFKYRVLVSQDSIQSVKKLHNYLNIKELTVQAVGKMLDPCKRVKKYSFISMYYASFVSQASLVTNL